MTVVISKKIRKLLKNKSNGMKLLEQLSENYNFKNNPVRTDFGVLKRM